MLKTGLKTLPRPWLATALCTLLCLAAVGLTFAETDPARGAAGDSGKDAAASKSATIDASASAYGHPAPIVGPTTAFHDSVASHYNYAFGKDAPFLPSNATTGNGQFWSPKAFPTAQYCGHCHQEAYHQWRQSVHSNSFRAPWYLKNVNSLIDE